MRILIVEDDIDVRDFLKRALEAECHTITATADGEKGSYVARTENFDVIILDNILPKKSGLEICREIRASGKTVPILVTTVQHELGDKLSLFNAGADDYICKPYALEELLVRMKAILRRPKALQDSVYTIGDLKLDSGSMKVSRANTPIHLTKKEFSLLEYLMRHAGHVVSRGMMMEYVWNKEDDPYSNTLESHILNLRRKIERKGEPKLIHNVPGRGYRIEVGDIVA